MAWTCCFCFYFQKHLKNSKMPVWIDTNEMKCPSKSTAMPAQLKKIIVLEKPEYMVQDNFNRTSMWNSMEIRKKN